ncbi:MAG: ferrous iron transport protein A [Candidatus Aminicenantes bacterium]|nr:ferrous iron transport protein A [Candidatus Aminicenantes bacterium]
MTRLVDCKGSTQVKIVKINAGRGALINLSNLGLHIGNFIKLMRKSPFKGPVIVDHQGSEVAIGYGLAQKIFVEEI